MIAIDDVSSVYWGVPRDCMRPRDGGLHVETTRGHVKCNRLCQLRHQVVMLTGCGFGLFSHLSWWK